MFMIITTITTMEVKTLPRVGTLKNYIGDRERERECVCVCQKENDLKLTL